MYVWDPWYLVISQKYHEWILQVYGVVNEATLFSTIACSTYSVYGKLLLGSFLLSCIPYEL